VRRTDIMLSKREVSGWIPVCPRRRAISSPVGIDQACQDGSRSNSSGSLPVQQPLDSDESVVRRFQPYDIGPPEAAWPYASLSAAEKAVVDAGKSAPQWCGIHSGYKQAVLQRAAEAHVHAAAIQIGLEDLGEGVVP
jgi:hypothetical protein